MPNQLAVEVSILWELIEQQVLRAVAISGRCVTSACLIHGHLMRYSGSALHRCWGTSLIRPLSVRHREMSSSGDGLYLGAADL